MEHKRLLQIVFIFFACGLSIELLKTLGKNSPLNLKPSTAGIKLEDYDVQLGTETVTLEMPVLPLANSLGGVPKINGVKLADKKKDDVKKDAKKDDKKKTDEKKQAKKKKKKKKKKIDSFEPDDDALAKTTKDKKDDFTGINAPGSYIVTNTTIANPPDKLKNLPKTLQEWENLLLKDPNAEETKKFVEHYRNREVNSEIYFTIAKKMLDDQRPQMRQMGLTLLESSPGPTSFELLSETYYAEPTNSAFRATLDRQLATYSRPESFNIIIQGLSREKSLAVNYTSVTVLNRAIERYKAEQARVASSSSNTDSVANPGAVPTTTTTPPATNTATTVRTTRTRTLFSRFQIPLKVLVAEGDPNLAPTASQALSQVLALLN